MGGSQCRASGAMQRLAAELPGLDEGSFLCAGGQRSTDACYVSIEGTGCTTGLLVRGAHDVQNDLLIPTGRQTEHNLTHT